MYTGKKNDRKPRTNRRKIPNSKSRRKSGRTKTSRHARSERNKV